LSYRVKSWIERTSRIDEVLHTPRIGLEAGRLIAAAKVDATVGIVDFDHVMAGLADDLREGGPKLKLSDATALFARLRSVADHAEVALAVKATEIARRALTSVPENEENLGVIIAAVEKAARCAGAEEIYIAAAPDLARNQHLMRSEGETKVGENFALRATVSYMGTWIRLGRTFTRNAGAASHFVRAAERFSDAAAQLPNPRAFATFPHWLLESCLTTQPLAPIMGSDVATGRTLAGGALVSLQARVSIDGRPIYLGAPALMGASGAGAKFLIEL
jgi:hypothetical protein